MSKRDVCNDFKIPLLDILIVIKIKNGRYNFYGKKKEVKPVKTVPELPGINIYYRSSLKDTDFVSYFVPISTSMPLACTAKKLYSLT